MVSNDHTVLFSRADSHSRAKYFDFFEPVILLVSNSRAKSFYFVPNPAGILDELLLNFVLRFLESNKICLEFQEFFSSECSVSFFSQVLFAKQKTNRF